MYGAALNVATQRVDRRSATRLRVAVHAELCEGARGWPCVVRDVSIGGALVQPLVRWEYAAPSGVQLALPLPGTGESLWVRAAVASGRGADDAALLGVSFASMATFDRRALGSWIDARMATDHAAPGRVVIATPRSRLRRSPAR